MNFGHFNAAYLLEFIYLIPVILISLTFHEFAHAFTAWKLGDPTAKNLGRLTLNPLRHLDPLGTLMLLIPGSGIGWAKPVPFNPVRFRDSKRGSMLVSVAGPLSNVILAFIFAFPMYYFGATASDTSSVQGVICQFSAKMYVVNIGLAVFNILPVPPLDGSKLLAGVMKERTYMRYLQYENIIGILLLLMVFMFPGVLSTILEPFRWVVRLAIDSVVVPAVRLLLGDTSSASGSVTQILSWLHG